MATVIVGVVLSILAAPLSVAAQPAPGTFRLAYCSLYRRDDPEVMVLLNALRQGLRDQGYVEGQNISLILRFAEERAERLPDLARDLVQLQPDLIIAANTVVIQAVKGATSTIPIVMASSGDPVAAGLVTSLAKPGGNVTGLSIMSPELNQKRLELFRQVAPRVMRVGVLRNPSNLSYARDWEETQAAAASLKLQLTFLEVRGPDDFAEAFRTAAQRRVQGLITVPDGVLFADRQRVVGFATVKRLPSVFWRKEFVTAGGLMAYGTGYTELYYKVGVFVDKILKGAKPGDLPIEQPTKFELVINLKTAKALGLTIPQSVLIRADEVIQ